MIPQYPPMIGYSQLSWPLSLIPRHPSTWLFILHPDTLCQVFSIRCTFTATRDSSRLSFSFFLTRQLEKGEGDPSPLSGGWFCISLHYDHLFDPFLAIIQEHNSQCPVWQSKAIIYSNVTTLSYLHLFSEFSSRVLIAAPSHSPSTSWETRISRTSSESVNATRRFRQWILEPGHARRVSILELFAFLFFPRRWGR